MGATYRSDAMNSLAIYASERPPRATSPQRHPEVAFHLVFLLISYLFLYMINLKSNIGLRGIMEISE
ncbi:hypothetical protein DY000_02001567 [Brassica cretica]|uniref:Uncharacterized protein n=1 Tax=Brassica cretica TaxID=69181 RepID=A0ABQ7BWY9_BRACR|nr:hypothetical protein DY000_02001567 [Brassica cretica]